MTRENFSDGQVEQVEGATEPLINYRNARDGC